MQREEIDNNLLKRANLFNEAKNLTLAAFSMVKDCKIIEIKDLSNTGKSQPNSVKEIQIIQHKSKVQQLISNMDNLLQVIS